VKGLQPFQYDQKVKGFVPQRQLQRKGGSDKTKVSDTRFAIASSSGAEEFLLRKGKKEK
jgi:hypothetical protein